MQTLPISSVKATLNELIESAVTTHNQVCITRNGVPAAVLVSSEEWESIQETMFWLSQPGIREDLAQASAELAAGETFSEEQIRAELGR
ncbi:MAG: type II toxin-antitoxin system Phd/YefM family antitoxin [Actinomycetota bacterium]|nr:type II toxin-antitoxin system Phd/YefM family antitoxin [Actinomycetota bacterium]